ncbi:hypothetical protein [Methanosarcina horonobensis]|uniref:hypothetical protein n=1 Tax=Methanosarcina horonobensis TaxID=418008 RepID=UPI000A4A0391|nr:hypothetical protein [Methanosarcina horonobensis]
MKQLFSLSESGAVIFAVLLITLMFISNLAGMRAISIINYAALAVLFLLTGLLIIFNLDFFGSGSRLPVKLSGAVKI